MNTEPTGQRTTRPRHTERSRSVIHSSASRRRSAVSLGSRQVPTGVVEVEDCGDGWILVGIGRARNTKRFNLTRGEAAELVRVLSEEILTADRPKAGAA
jgi:hypothetical protein